MKDYIDSPDRLVNIKGLDATITATPDGGLKIGSAVKIVDLAEHAQVARLYPAVIAAAVEVGTPQIRNQGTVGGNINQRPRCWYFRNEEFVCYKKGGSRCFAVDRREPVPRHLRQRRSEPHRASVEPGGAVRRLRREVPRRSARTASARSPRPTTSRCRRCRTC